MKMMKCTAACAAVVWALGATAEWTWVDGTRLPIEGKAFADTERYYDRLPSCWSNEYTKSVWSLQRCSAGLAFRFVTDAEKLRVRWSLTGASLAMAHMPATGVSGVDVYQYGTNPSPEAKDAKPGWQFCKPPFPSSLPRGQFSNEFEVAVRPGLVTMIYLPTYNGVSEFALGLPKGNSVKPAPVRASGVVKPVVFYGTSTTQGGCTSRPSTAWPSIVGMEADVPIVNLGFSGSGQMEDIMVDVLARIDASLYVLDTIGNVNVKLIGERYEKFVRRLREKRPGVPIIVTVNTWCDEWHDRNEAIRAVYRKIKASDPVLWKDLTLAGESDTFVPDRNYAVEGVHLNDWGAWNVGRGFARAVSAALGLKPATGVVSFRDAGKIRSWDAWNDHEAKAAVTNILQNEKKCVTWETLNALDYGLKEIGRLKTRTSSEIRGSKWSVGCETLDRDYAVWDNYKALLPMLGVKHARFFSGWAKTEQEKGVYDFTWLDPQIRECAAMKIKPWVCVSYGNPVWGSDFRLGMRVSQITGDPKAFDAWIRYVKALVARYADVVDEWEVWNEPFCQGEEYAELFYRTAKAIREVQPRSQVFCTAVAMAEDMKKSDYGILLEKLKRENALDLASAFIFHPYKPVPDSSYEIKKTGEYEWNAESLETFVKGYSDRFYIMQGETGCPAQLEFAHAMNGIEWTEYSQAKWDTRRAICDAVRGIPSNIFTMIDLQYTFMLQSFGLIRSNALKEFVYRRPKWYAMRNVFALFDDDTKPVANVRHLPAEIMRRADPRDAVQRKLTRADFSRFGRGLHLFWYEDERPSNRLEFDRVTLRVPGKLADPVWVDMITGRVAVVDAKNVKAESGETVLTDVPMWDSPVLIADRAAVPIDIVPAVPGATP